MKRLLFVFVLLAVSLSARAMDMSLYIPSPPTGYPTFTAVQSGPWNLGATWGGTVPGLNAVVTIPPNVVVTIDHLEPNDSRAPKWVRVEGTLAISNTVSTRFYVETIHVPMGGTLSLGTINTPLPMGQTAEIIFTSPNADFDKTWDKQQVTRGLIADGFVRMFGISRTYAAAVTTDVPKGARTMNLAVTPSNWQPGDELVLAGTYFRRNAGSQDELRHFGSFAGSTLTIAASDTAFQNDHLHVTTGAGTPTPITPNFHIANLTRNVIFSSEFSTPTYRRGHVMLMNSDSQIQFAAFINLGRTDKSTPLDDYKVIGGQTIATADTSIFNIRGRYPLHVHKAGWGPGPYDGSKLPQTNITGCVVNNTPGWAFVNHSSNVDFRRNVAYNFTGAGFVAEDGDEIGYFVNNIAIRGTGDPHVGYDKARINFANPTRPQPVADFGFNGDGFWFNGPALRVNGAIASGCNGRGMIWHTTGVVNIHSLAVTPPYGHYTFFNVDSIPLVYTNGATLKPRTWKFDAMKKSAVIADLPILSCTNVESYGNFIGLHLRFNNFDDIAWYTEDPYNFDDQIDPAFGQTANNLVPTRLRETISNVTAWNDETAFALRYDGDADLTSFTAINRLDYDDVDASRNPSIAPSTGVESFFNLRNITYSNLITDGWDVANYFSNVQNAASVVNLNPGTPTPRNYALTGTWDHRPTPETCGAVTLGVPTVGAGGTTTTLRWTASDTRYLIRYRIAGSQQWIYTIPTTSSSFVVPTVAGQSYVWQVIGGCGMSISNYTPQGSFHT